MGGDRDRGHWLPAFGVHIVTASGAGLALLALLAAAAGNWVAMFAWLGAALFVDGIDGTLARRLNVKDALPRWSGDALDFVVDFTTYVFVPAYAIAASGLLPQAVAVPLGVIIVVSSAIYFADAEMKTADNYFRGFPVLWNAAAFYLFVIKPAPWLGAILILGLVVMTFLPIRFIHPFRVARGRAVTIAALVLWSVLAAVALYRNLDPGPWVGFGLLALGLYFFAGGALYARRNS
jgi:phosphatidylcholine synthase